MSGRTPSSYDHRLSINITRPMYERLTQIANNRDEAISEIAREALRLFLDDQEDLIGSRKHFSKSFQQRLDHTDWQLSVQLQMLSHLTALFMTMINQKISAQGMSCRVFWNRCRKTIGRISCTTHGKGGSRRKNQPPVKLTGGVARSVYPDVLSTSGYTIFAAPSTTRRTRDLYKEKQGVC